MKYRGYKEKWDMFIEGEQKRINKNGYMQILDENTRRWVTVDRIEEEDKNEI